MKLDNQIVINTGYCLGDDEFANAFLASGARTYIGTTDYIEANAVTFFIISLLYFHLCRNYTFEDYYRFAISNDDENRLSKLYSK